jgi:hypothetical protein
MKDFNVALGNARDKLMIEKYLCPLESKLEGNPQTVMIRNSITHSNGRPKAQLKQHEAGDLLTLLKLCAACHTLTTLVHYRIILRKHLEL